MRNYNTSRANNGKAKRQPPLAHQIFDATPLILVPAATGPAPAGTSYTGDARMNAPWTALGTPAISIPMSIGPGLPLGLQLTAASGEDVRLLRTAVRVHALLHTE
jgi:Asp-tRNA(Asn)/Glu-tRNA(Gln) amidotransferase A subunit family amidase